MSEIIVLLVRRAVIATVCCLPSVVVLPGLPAPALACSCELPRGRLVWPKDGARDVSIDPDIVVSVPRESPTTVHLTGPSGERVELNERRREANGEHIRCEGAMVFLTPSAALAPNARYALVFRGDFDAGADAEAPSFTTGSERVAVPQPTELSVQFDRLIQGAHCDTRATPSCPDLADLLFEETTREEAPPSWLRVRTGGDAPYDELLFYLPGSFSLGSLPGRYGSLALDSHDACVAYERIDVGGRIIAQEEVCTARRCAVLGETNWSGPSPSSCGDIPPLFEGFWEAAGETSCAAPPRIEQDPVSGELRRAKSDTGCSVVAAGFTAPQRIRAPALACLALLAAALRSRSRSRLG